MYVILVLSHQDNYADNKNINSTYSIDHHWFIGIVEEIIRNTLPMIIIGRVVGIKLFLQYYFPDDTIWEL